MLNGEMDKPLRRDWIWANPWLWNFSGLFFCLVGLLMVRTLGETLEGVRVSLVFLGVLLAGIGVTVRMSSPRPAVLDQMSPPVRRRVLIGLAMIFAAIAVALTILVALRFFEINPVDLRFNSLVILWLVGAPLSFAAAVVCARRSGPRQSPVMTPAEESAAVLVLAALTAFTGCWALYNPPVANEWGLYLPDTTLQWDSIRLFLAALFVVALLAAPLVVVSQSVRRCVISLLILLHFGGIAAAVMSPTPSPWIANQMWGRIYQPYLEFMYLNNAYHFYAPEPGPASFLWFRLYYEDPQGKEYASWLKIPDVDERGWHKSAVALNYQRMLALTENVITTDPTPNINDGDWYSQRSLYSSRERNIGMPELEPDALVIPFHPNIPRASQYLRPNWAAQTLLKSYARHVCKEKHPGHPDLQIKHVKIYRVVHQIPDMTLFVNENLDVRDPVNFRPFYMGKYDPDGNLLDYTHIDKTGKLVRGDPFLYWLLPMWREQPAGELRSPIKSWVAKHADDPDWIYTYDEVEKRPLLEEERKNLRGK